MSMQDTPITDDPSKSAQERLHSSLKELEHIKHALDVSTIVAITDKHGTITYVNDAFCRISKYSREELLGQNHRIINSGYHSHAFFKDMWASIGSGQVWRADIKNKAKDGSFYWVDTTIVPYLDEHGKPYQYVAIRHDITRQKLAEEELRQLSTALEQKVEERTAQLKAINKELEAFTYSVSHDLRAPLRSLDGFSQLVLEMKADQLDDEGKEYLGYVRESAQDMAQLIDDLLNLSRLSRAELRKEWVNLSEMMAEIAHKQKEQEPERQIEIRIQPDLHAEGDSHLLRAAFQNLFANAWKFTRQQPNPVIEFGQMEKEGANVFFVRDNGVGFDMKYVNKLFGAFQRLHDAEEFPGTGVGLATVQRIIHRHGGAIWAEAVVNQGATFYFTL
jgi:PAS domain S-box-containing protein